MNERQKNILVVDDEVSFGQLMVRILADGGYLARFTASGSEALELLREDAVFDLVMTDINMPDMDGLVLMRTLREDFPGLAVLVTTGINKREVAMQALEMGAYGYILKPCDDFEVMVHVENALRRSALETLSRNYQDQLQQQVAERTAELEETNRMLRQQEKLASIGQLAAGIAHEIKTPNGFVISNLKSLKKYQAALLSYLAALQQVVDERGTAADKEKLQLLSKQLKIAWITDDAVDLVENCLEGALRIRAISEGLKGFSRQEDGEKQPFDLNQAIEDSLMLVGNELKYKAEVHRRLAELPALTGYRQRLEQVFINLLVNAAQAIEKQGTIEVSTELVDGEIVVKINDDGGGIPNERLERIFEPFYTSKDIGVGTGLGLSIVKEIIAEHAGRIEADSTVGVGSTFTIFLPIGS